jgi:hypothetical protein
MRTTASSTCSVASRAASRAEAEAGLPTEDLPDFAAGDLADMTAFANYLPPKASKKTAGTFSGTGQ